MLRHQLGVAGRERLGLVPGLAWSTSALRTGGETSQPPRKTPTELTPGGDPGHFTDLVRESAVSSAVVLPARAAPFLVAMP